MQGFHLDSAATGTYRRDFTLPADWNGKRVKLRFDAVSSHCEVKVNGRIIGSHEGSFVPFEFDVTSAVKAGNNHLEVAVQCQTISDMLACTSQYAGHPVGGIIRKVTLFALPAVNLSGLTYITRFDDRYSDATMTLPLTVTNEGNRAAAVQLKVALTDAGGKSVPLSRSLFTVGSVAAGSSKEMTVSLPVKAPEKWNSEHPYLYTLTTTLMVDGSMSEIYREHAGFREVRVEGDRLLVNGRPVKLHGVCRHSIDPYSGRSVSPESCRADARLLREGNCNYVRTSHYPPEEEFLDACDSLGLFVESESSLCWIGHGAAPIWKRWRYDDPRYLPLMMQANLEKMAADRDHPSVILWSLGNESKWSPLWDSVNRRVKALDPSRPTVFQDQSWGTYNNAGSTTDIGNYHYPDFDDAAASDTMRRPLLFDEFAHVENYNRLEVLTDPYVRVAWGPSLERIYDSMYAHPGCLGGAIWAGIDDIFHMPDHRMIGYGPWGVIDGWRRKKPEFYGMKQAFTPVKLVRAAQPLVHDGVATLEVENRYDFLNLSSLSITCETGGRPQRLKADIAPHHTGTLRIPVRPGEDSLRIIFRDPRGFESQEIVVAVKQASHEEAAPLPKARVELTETPGRYVMSAAGVTYRVSRSSGMLEDARTSADRIPLTSPQMMVVPLNNDDGGGPGITNCTYQTHLPPLMYRPFEGWKAESVKAARLADGSVRVTVEGTYRDAKGSFRLEFLGDGTLRIGYDFVMGDSVKLNPRQWGLVLSLPSSFDRLRWRRKGHWSSYPRGDIARNAGQAMAEPAARDNSLTWERPSGSWPQDANQLGTNDFRSTKAHIYHASLSDDAGRGIAVLSDGSQAVRAWVDGDKTMLLTADYNTGGSDRFSAFFFQASRHPLQGGDRITGTLHLKLLDPTKN